MPNKIPTPRSKPQILGDMIAAFLSRTGLKQLKIGSPVLSILEAGAQSDMRSSQDIFDLLRSDNLDDSTGVALDRHGADEDTPRIYEGPAVGMVTITDSNFSKVATKLYQGTPAPLIGAGTLNVADASSWPTSGSLYIGRGTSNYEGPLAYNGLVNNSTYWTITLVGTTAKYHNIGETVVLAQGGLRSINAGTTVQTPQGAVSSAVQFTTLYPTAIPDGETQITNVSVIAIKNGVIGNIAAGTIQSFVTPPFAGATVTNPLPFTNATSTEDDDTYRERIRAARASRIKGTSIAVLTSVQGLVAADENRRVSSASLVTRQGYPTTLYLDDGTGYEESSLGIAFESLNDSAYGGEQYFQTAYRPVTKAFLQSTIAAPFALASGMKLAFSVGGISTEHTFSATDARSIGAATAYEVVSSINADANLLWGARTAGSGTMVVVFAKADAGEDILNVPPAVGVDANPFMGFVTTKALTMRLYKNDRLLAKDGQAASVSSQPYSAWGSFSGNQTLTVAVDGTAAATYTFVDQDFVNAVTGFTAVGRNTPAAWVAVINAKIPGITAALSPTGFTITSNLGANSRASVAITGGTLTAVGMFTPSSASGSTSDYTLDRNTGQVRTSIALTAGDRLTLGSQWTRAFLETPSISTLSLTNQGNLWLSVDGSSQTVTTALTSTSSLTVSVGVARGGGFRIRFTSVAHDYDNVQVGDQVVFWDNAFAGKFLMNGVFRVSGIDTTNHSWFEIEKPCMNHTRWRHTATVLTAGAQSGRVLVAGGSMGWSDLPPTTASAFLFDPTSTTNPILPVPDMNVPRTGHTATLVSGGTKVFIFGGKSSISGGPISSGEIFDSATNTWTLVSTTGAPSARWRHAAVLRADGKVLIIGGDNGANIGQTSCYIYDPAGDTWSAAGSLATGRFNHDGGLLTVNSKIVVAGGESAGVCLSSVELYDPGANTWSAAGALQSARTGLKAIALDANQVAWLGGSSAQESATTTATVLADVDAYAVGGGMGAGPTLTVASAFHTVGTFVGNGNVFSGFGIRAAGVVAEYNSGGVWHTVAGSAITTKQRGFLAGTVSATGNKFYVFGGRDTDAAKTAWGLVETYSNDTDTFFVSEPIAGTSNITNIGVLFARAGVPLRQVAVAPGTNYTASSLASNVSSVWVATGNGTVSGTANTAVLTGVGSNFTTFGVGDQISVDGGTTWYDITAVNSDTSLTIAPYLASTVAGVVWLVRPTGGQLKGAFSTTYKTNKLRFSTNSFALGSPSIVGGDIALAAQDTQASKLGFTVANATSNLIGHMASVESGNSELGFPVLMGQNVVGSLSRSAVNIWSSAGPASDLTSQKQGSNHKLLVLRTPVESYSSNITRYGSNKNFSSFFVSQTLLAGDDTLFRLRSSVNRAWVPGERIAMLSPFSISHDDALIFIVDGDTVSKRFTPNLFRHLKPTGGSFGVTNVMSDADSNASTGTSFGLNYDFSDFKVSMRARVKTHDGNLNPPYTDFTKTILWRWWRHGLCGDLAKIRYVLPTGPNQPVGVTVDDTSTRNHLVSISLASGAAKTGYSIHLNATRLGFATTGAAQNGMYPAVVVLGFPVSSAQRAGGTVTLTLTLPSGVTNHGLTNGTSIYLKTTDVNLVQGSYAITGTTPTTISYVDGGGNFGPVAPAAGTTISWDTQEATLNGTVGGANAGDFFSLSASTGAPVGFYGQTVRLTATGPQYMAFGLPGFTGAPSTTVQWSLLTDTTGFQIFTNPAQTAATINAAVTALYNSGNGLCPVYGTLIGDGSGTIDRATAEEKDDNANWNGGSFYYALTDGLNFISSATPPGGLGGNYTFTFKNPIDNALLATNSDWANEDVIIVPVTAQSLVNWLNTPTICGAFASCSIQTSSRNSRVQIASNTMGSSGSVQVQGGTGNSLSMPVIGAAVATGDARGVVSIARSNVPGLSAGSWVSFQNSITLPKGTGSAPGITTNTALSSFLATGVLTVSGDKLWDFSATPTTNCILQVERVGPLVVVHDTGIGTNALNLSGVNEGDWVVMSQPAAPTGGSTPKLNSVNTGTFQVVRIVQNVDGGGGSYWIEAPLAIEDQGEADIKFIKYDSAMPGDKLVITSSVWGLLNQGTWTVTQVGNNFTSGTWYTLTVDTTTSKPTNTTAAALGARFHEVYISEGTPSRLLKSVLGICPNQTSSTLANVKIDSSVGVKRITQAAGTVMTVFDKLAFPLGLAVGVDGYKHSVGLIGEANRVVYGDPRDTSTYPGVASSGAVINISGPNVRRTVISVQLRVKSGSTTQDIATAVKSAIASVVNKTGVGQPIALGAIVAAAQKVPGVISAVIISPTYNSANDLISIQPFEKPLILNLDTDVSVSFIGA